MNHRVDNRGHRKVVIVGAKVQRQSASGIDAGRHQAEMLVGDELIERAKDRTRSDIGPVDANVLQC
jgi:hypothetical protein